MNNKATLTGILVSVLPETTGVSKNGKQWTKQPFIIETSMNPSYESKVALSTFNQEVINKILTFPLGSKLDVECRIVSRDGQNGRWYTEATATDIRPSQQTQFRPQQPQQQAYGQPQPPQMSQQQFSNPMQNENDRRFVQHFQQPAPQPAPQQDFEMGDLPF